MAGRTLRNAVYRGIVKRLPCEICGEEKVHGHHDDYSKPLEVAWLCNSHHMQLHAGVLEEAQDIVRTSVRAEEVGRNAQPSLSE